MREQLHIPEERLRAILQEEYGLIAVTFALIPQRLDFNAFVYRVVSNDGTRYLLKLTSMRQYTKWYSPDKQTLVAGYDCDPVAVATGLASTVLPGGPALL